MLLEGNWRWKKCCCFTVQTGTTIIAIIRIIAYLYNFIVVCTAPNYDDSTEDSGSSSYFRQTMALALNPGTKALFGILAAVDIILSSLVLHGNFKNTSKIMKPAIYWWLISIIINTIISIVGIAQAASADTSFVAPLVVGMVIGWVLNLWLTQVVRCRIADIEEVETH